MYTMSEKRSSEGIFKKTERVKRATYKEQAYQLLKEAILYQKLKTGEIYSQENICEELGVSRTPVREALLELQKEGYSLFHRGKGIQVISMDDEAIHEILEARLYLEKACAELAAKHANETDIAYIKSCLGSEYEARRSQDEGEADIAKSYRLDHQFHRSVARAAHNRQLYDMLDNMLNMYLRFETQSVYNNAAYANKILEEHTAIYQKIAEHDAEKAVYSSEQHLLQAYHRTLYRYWAE